MKKYAYLTLALVLTASLLVGCGCTNQNKDNTSAPTVLPTNEEVWDNTETTARPTTEPDMTMTPTETFDRGNGPLEDTTGSTEGANGTDGTNSANGSGGTDSTDPTGTSEARSRSIMPKMR